MTPPTSGTVSTDIADIRVVVARIEEAVKPLTNLETRLTTVEVQNANQQLEIARLELKNKELELEIAKLQKQLADAVLEIEKIKATRRKPITFGTAVPIIASCFAILLAITSLQSVRDTRTEQTIQNQISQKNQEQIIKQQTEQQKQPEEKK